MTRPVTLFTGQWADLPLEVLCKKARSFGYDGIELACWGDHFEVEKAVEDESYLKRKWDLLTRHGLGCYAISHHLAGQAVCDRIDERHKTILPPRIWGDGQPNEVQRRAAEEMKNTARAARRFFDLAPDPVAATLEKIGRLVVNGFTGSSIWPFLYSFPPNGPGLVEAGFADFARRWLPILEVFRESGVHFALEVHPTEIAFDTVTARRALKAISGHPNFGFNFDPSHFGYQNVDYIGFLREFKDRILHVHVKDLWWSPVPGDCGTFGGHLEFGEAGRSWDFRSPGRGRLDFEAIIRQLQLNGYQGPLSVEWEDAMMDREHGAAEACAFVRRLEFKKSDRAFDAAFSGD